MYTPMRVEENVREALRDVHDPEIPVNIVDLGLVYDIESDDGTVNIDMTLTSMGCPIADQIKRDVEVTAMSVDEVETVSVSLVWDPPWDPSKATDDGKAQLRSFGITVQDNDTTSEPAPGYQSSNTEQPSGPPF